MEGAFVDGLALLQPTAGYMRLVNDRILCVWRQRCAEAGVRTAEQERRVKATRQKLDRLDEAFLHSESIDLDTDSRQRDRLREELTLSTTTPRPSKNSTWRASWRSQNGFCPAPRTLWVQASLDYRQRLQELFFPEGNCVRRKSIQSNRRNRAAFRYLEPDERAESSVASPGGRDDLYDVPAVAWFTA